MTSDLAVALAGFAIGWLSFFPPRRNSVTLRESIESLSVVIPARDEEHNIGQVVASLRSALGDGIEIVVADDRSRDETALRAARAGAIVVSVDEPPEGWTGKAHACWVGQQRVSRRHVMFVDADVRFGRGASDVVATALSTLVKDSTTLASVQPWHIPKGFFGRFAMLFNVVSVMASRGRGLWVSKRPLAFGPVMMCDVVEYRRRGGHAHELVKGSIVEDIALSRLFDRGVVQIGASDSVTFRMYDKGIGQVVEGFTKNLASGGSSTSLAAVAGVAAWFVFLCSPVVLGSGWYFVCVVQVYALSRVVGKFGVIHALLYPVHVVFFLAVLLRSMWLRFVTRSVTWKGRAIAFYD